MKIIEQFLSHLLHTDNGWRDWMNLMGTLQCFRLYEMCMSELITYRLVGIEKWLCAVILLWWRHVHLEAEPLNGVLNCMTLFVVCFLFYLITFSLSLFSRNGLWHINCEWWLERCIKGSGYDIFNMLSQRLLVETKKRDMTPQYWTGVLKLGLPDMKQEW